MLHVSIFFFFFFHIFNVLLNKSNCFRTVELHVVQVIVILFNFSFDLPQEKNRYCKIQITAKKNFNLRYFVSIFLLIDSVSNTNCPILLKLEQSC